jgi:hypothetical protein
MKTAPKFCLVATLAAAAGGALAQSTKGPQRVVRPPIAQAWIDVATFSGMGMPMGGGSPLNMLGGMFGGQTKNNFLNTQAGGAGQWLDVTLSTRNTPALAEAVQRVPETTRLAPELKLRAPQAQRPAPPDDEGVVESEHERPKGRLLMYWGCGDTVRAGQPRVLDMTSASATDLQRFFVSRRATQRGAHSAAGRPHWPNSEDARMVPAGASLVGEHAFSGQGVPDGFRFAIGPAQDFMPPIELAQRDAGGATQLQWQGLPNARAYFIAAMGSRGESEMIIWTSSEVADFGMGLIDYQTNAAVDRWLGERVLLAPSVTSCIVPKGIFGEAAMLRMIGYGTELNVAHPPRPADPRIAWEPQWAATVRVKSVATAMLGMDMGAMMRGGGRGEQAPQGEPKSEEKKPGALDILRGILGR